MHAQQLPRAEADMPKSSSYQELERLEIEILHDFTDNTATHRRRHLRSRARRYFIITPRRAHVSANTQQVENCHVSQHIELFVLLREPTLSALAVSQQAARHDTIRLRIRLRADAAAGPASMIARASPRRHDSHSTRLIRAHRSTRGVADITEHSANHRLV
jgi:hypothetical protein